MRMHWLCLAGVYLALQGGMYVVDSERALVEIASGAPLAAWGLSGVAFLIAAVLRRSIQLRFRNVLTTILGGCVLLGWLVFGTSDWATAAWARSGFPTALGLRAVDSILLAVLAAWILFRRRVLDPETSLATAALEKWTTGDVVAALLAVGALGGGALFHAEILRFYHQHQVIPFLTTGLQREAVEPEFASGNARALAYLGKEHAAALEVLVTAAADGSVVAIKALEGEAQAVPTGQGGLSSASLRVVVADNQAYGPEHLSGYSGLAELAVGDGPNLFVSAYSGLNFEHIFNGDEATYDWHIFEPRRAAMELWRLAPTCLQLRQERTEHWPLATTITYTLAGSDAIDMTVLCRPQEDGWAKHGYLGVFFASYIHAPEDLAIHFIGRSRPGKGDAAPRWIRHLSPRHGEAACHRSVGVTWDPPLDAGFKIPLAAGHSDLEYVYPFYYGVTHGKALIFLFERPRGVAETRLAQSPTGGGEGNPAWDFVFLNRKCVKGETYRFRARLVVRDFRGADDVIGVYERWSGTRVQWQQ